jgi:hypothetical protein
MKKLIVGLAAVGAVIALRPVVKRRMVQKMREHCKQMMGQFQDRGEAMDREAMAHKMREHCEPTTAHQAARGEPVGTT